MRGDADDKSETRSTWSVVSSTRTDESSEAGIAEDVSGKPSAPAEEQRPKVPSPKVTSGEPKSGHKGAKPKKPAAVKPRPPASMAGSQGTHRNAGAGAVSAEHTADPDSTSEPRSRPSSAGSQPHVVIGIPVPAGAPLPAPVGGQVPACPAGGAAGAEAEPPHGRGAPAGDDDDDDSWGDCLSMFARLVCRGLSRWRRVLCRMLLYLIPLGLIAFVVHVGLKHDWVAMEWALFSLLAFFAVIGIVLSCRVYLEKSGTAAPKLEPLGRVESEALDYVRLKVQSRGTTAQTAGEVGYWLGTFSAEREYNWTSTETLRIAVAITPHLYATNPLVRSVDATVRNASVRRQVNLDYQLMREGVVHIPTCGERFWRLFGFAAEAPSTLPRV